MIINKITLLFVTSILVTCLFSCSKKPYIRYDGYYSNKEQYNNVVMYLKFYTDGTVTAALPPTINNIIKITPNQLNKDSKECDIKGKYTLNGNNVVFKLLDKNGSADFTGQFQENKIVLHSHSNINGKDSDNSYDFYKL